MVSLWLLFRNNLTSSPGFLEYAAAFWLIYYLYSVEEI